MKSFNQFIAEGSAVCFVCQADPCICDDSHGFVSEDTNQLSEVKDEREYGYEGDMALNQLATAQRCAQMLKDMLKPDTDMPEWIQSKITLATDYLQTAADYMYSEMNEETNLDDMKRYYREEFVAEGEQDLSRIEAGRKVLVPHPRHGKMVPGKIVRYNVNKGRVAPAYEVDIGEPETIQVIPNKVVKQGQGVAEGNQSDSARNRRAAQAHEQNLDAAHKELRSRDAEGEDMSDYRVNPRTYKVEKKGVAEGSEWETRHDEFSTVGDRATPEQINKIVNALGVAAKQAGSKRGFLNQIVGKQSNGDLARMAHGAETLAKNIQRNSRAEPGTDERKELGQHLVYAVSLLKRMSGKQGVAEGRTPDDERTDGHYPDDYVPLAKVDRTKEPNRKSIQAAEKRAKKKKEGFNQQGVAEEANILSFSNFTQINKQ